MSTKNIIILAAAVAIFLALVVYTVANAAGRLEACAVQGRLTALKLYRGQIDCVYNSATREAIEDFQRSHGLPAIGIVGPRTYRKLFGRNRGDNSPFPSADHYEPVDLKAGDQPRAK